MDVTWEPSGTVRGRVVLLHGVMSSAATWWRIGPALAARGWRVLAMDLPGHGEGPRLGRAATVGLLAGGIAGRLAEPADLLIGHSLGAIVALALTARQPSLARALVLEEPPASTTSGSRPLAESIAADTDLARTDRERLLRRESRANPRWLRGDVERSVEGIAAAEAVAIVGGLRSALQWDLPALMSAAQVPVLVLAAPDTPGPFALCGGSALHGADRSLVRNALPEDRFRVIEGGHCLHRDQPAAWVREVHSFAAEVAPRGR